jgi:hypothetical protein
MSFTGEENRNGKLDGVPGFDDPPVPEGVASELAALRGPKK